MKITFIGTGVMGASIVEHLLAAQHEVTIYTRTKVKAQHLIEQGAIWSETVANAVKHSELVFTMVGLPSDVREVYLGNAGIIENAKPGTIVVDMTTSEPSLAQEIYTYAKQKQVSSLDAPVSGGDIGAKNGTLSIMVGGEEAVLQSITSVLAHFGKAIEYHGAAGSGQHAKMCNQIVVANNLIGVCESITYAVKAGLQVERVLASITPGAAGSWSLSNLGPKIANKDYEPGFYSKHMLKDLVIAVTEMQQRNVQLPGLEKATQLFQLLIDAGYGDLGTQALIKQYMSNY